MVLVQFAVVVMRYVFGIGSLTMQQSVVYMHAIIFMVAAGYALKDDAHVRIDIFYSKISTRHRAYINFFGSTFGLLPLCVVVLVQGWPYVRSSWAALEGAPEGTGLQGIFVLKTAILIYPTLIGLQAAALAIRSCAEILGGAPDANRQR